MPGGPAKPLRGPKSGERDAESGERGAKNDLRGRILGFLRARFSRSRATGLYLTVAVVLTLFFLWGFLDLAEDLGGSSALAALDGRVLTFVISIRSAVATRVLWGATVLGDTPSMAALVVLAGALLLAWGKRTYAALVAGSVAVAWGIEALAKAVVHRARPPMATALIQVPSSFSFPSGHALISLVFFGMLAFLAVLSVRRRLLKGAMVAASALAVATVGFSRIYLGVHWMTDVLASWALGTAWLSVSMGAYLIWDRFGRPLPDSRPWGKAGTRRIVTVVLVLVAVAVVVIAAQFDPLLAKAISSGADNILRR